MADTKEKCLALLSSTSGVDLNGLAGTETTLYTVPTGKTAIITHIIIRSLSADTTAATGTFGVTGGDCDEFGATQLWNIHTNLDNSVDGEYGVVYLDQSTSGTVRAGRMIDAGESFGYEVTAAASVACTCTMDVFGYLF